MTSTAMTTTLTGADRPKILRFASSKDQTCTGDDCGATIARGDRAGFDCMGGPKPLCTSCCDRLDGGEPTRPAPDVARVDEQPPAAAPDGPAAGEPPTADVTDPAQPAAASTCSCTKRGGPGDGYTNAADPGEPPRYVHSACGLPSPGAVAVRTVDVERTAEPDAAATPAVGDEGVITTAPATVETILEVGPGEGRVVVEVAPVVEQDVVEVAGPPPVPLAPVVERAVRNSYVTEELDEWLAGIPMPNPREHTQQLVDDAKAHAAAQPASTAPIVVDEDGVAMPLPNLAPYMADATQWGADPERTAANVVDAVRRGILAGDIRGRQREIGPSEIGHECARWLAYRLAGTPHTGTEPTPWRQRIGTLVHADLDDHLHRDNVEREHAGQAVRWLTGIRVDVGELYPGRTITGTLDVFDMVTGAVLDAKVPGSTAMRTYANGKPEKPSYRVQVQLYGRGVMRAGYLPAWVGVLRLSPARELSEYIVKVEKFDAAVAETALGRAGGIARIVDQLGDRAAELLPPTDAYCTRCPWFRPGSPDLTTGCPGAPGAVKPRRASVDDLVA